MTRQHILLCALLLLPNIRCDLFNFHHSVDKTLEARFGGNKHDENLQRPVRSIPSTDKKDKPSQETSTIFSSFAGLKTGSPAGCSSPGKTQNKRASILQEEGKQVANEDKGKTIKRQENITQESAKEGKSAATLDKRESDLYSLHEVNQNETVARQERQDENITRPIEKRQDGNSSHHHLVHRQIETDTHSPHSTERNEEESASSGNLGKRQDEKHRNTEDGLEKNRHSTLKKREDEKTNSTEESDEDSTEQGHVRKRQDDSSNSSERTSASNDDHDLIKTLEKSSHHRIVRGNLFLDEYRRHLADRRVGKENVDKRSLPTTTLNPETANNEKDKERARRNDPMTEKDKEEETLIAMVGDGVFQEPPLLAQESQNTEQKRAFNRPTPDIKGEDANEGVTSAAGKRVKRSDSVQTVVQRLTTKRFYDEADADDEDIEEKEEEANFQNKRENVDKKPGERKRWDHWGAWSPCSVSCGVGKVTRWRHCIGASCAPGEKEAQIKTCSLTPCT